MIDRATRVPPVASSARLALCASLAIGLSASPACFGATSSAGVTASPGKPAATQRVNAAPNRAEIELGKMLFEDTSLSADRTTACTTCHVASSAYGDPRARSTGVHHALGTRHAPSLLNLDRYTCFFWDCRATSLEAQVAFPLLNSVEMGFSTADEVVNRIRANPGYVAAFERIYGLKPSALHLGDVARPIVAYERSLTHNSMPLDRFLAGDPSALDPASRRGLEVFRSRASCATCHLVTADSAALTDGAMHPSALGLRRVEERLPVLVKQLESLGQAERILRIATDDQVAALGRFAVTLEPKDLGVFRTPTLREVSRVGPYMHDGSVATLSEAVDLELYYRGIELGYPIILSPQERSDLLVFLQGLVSDTSNPNGSSRVARN